MKKFFLISIFIITIGAFLLPQRIQAAVSEACRSITDFQKHQNCVSCEGDQQQGTWVKIPIPVVFNPTIDLPYASGEGKLRDITYNGHCIHNPAIFMFMLYYFGLLLLAIITFFILIYGGTLYLVSLGNAEKTKHAKEIMLGAVFGLILGLLSYLIVDFISPDLTGFHWSTEPLRELVEKSFKEIETEEEKAKECGADSVAACKGEEIGAICTSGLGEKGYCEEDPNIEGCVCNKDECANNCDGGNIDCKEKACSSPAVAKGQCVENLAAGGTSCMDIAMACSADCGENAAQSWDGLNCYGAYDCTIPVGAAVDAGKSGFCLADPSKKTGTDLCVAFDTLCNNSSCGSDYGEFYFYDQVIEKCNGIIYGGDLPDNSEGVCFGGGVVPWSAGDPDFGGGPGESCGVNDADKACILGGGGYGICSSVSYSCEPYSP